MTLRLSCLVLWCLLQAVFADQDGMLSRLLKKVDRLEDHMALLDERLDRLEGLSVKGKENEVTLDFKIMSLSVEFDEMQSLFNISMSYESETQPVILLITYSSGFMELAHEKGTVQFSLPITEVSPTLAVFPSPDLYYELVLIASGGPPPSPNISNLALTSLPEHSIAFPPHGVDPELTVTTSILGNRRIKKESMGYEVFSLQDNTTTSFHFGHFPDDVSSDSDVTLDDDVTQSPEAGEGSANHRLRLVEHTKQNDSVTYRFKLNTGFEDRGVLQMEHSVQFDCSGGCVLYEAKVVKTVGYYREDLYETSGPLGVPYRKGTASADAGNYLNFISPAPADVTTVTCEEGQQCRLHCQVFGDGPRLQFLTQPPDDWPQALQAERGDDRQSLQDYRLYAGRAVAVQVSYYQAMAFLQFSAVTREAAGWYACQASTGNSRSTKLGLLQLVVE